MQKSTFAFLILNQSNFLYEVNIQSTKYCNVDISLVLLFILTEQDYATGCVAHIFHTIANIFHSVANIFHSVANIFHSVAHIVASAGRL